MPTAQSKFTEDDDDPSLSFTSDDDETEEGSTDSDPFVILSQREERLGMPLFFYRGSKH